MTGDYDAQVRKQLREAQAALAAAEAALARLHAGEEPYEDERLSPTPAQWIWHWNRATPEERMSMAEHRVDLLEITNRCQGTEMHRARIGELHELRQDWTVQAAGLAEARMWARHGYEIGQRHCGWSDHGVAPAWLTAGWPPHIDACAHLTALGQAEARIAAVRALHYGESSKWDDGGLQCFICREPNWPCSTLAALDSPAEQATCCVCGTASATYFNHLNLAFCPLCADCQCGQDVCVRTGIADAAVSSAAGDSPNDPS